jgi:diphthine-ammonia ligase
MKVGVLFSGGKDSTFAAYLAKKNGHEIKCLISLFSQNPESYMFHTPNILKVKKQAEIMELPLLIQKTKGKKEEELKDLEKAIKLAKEKYDINAIVSGALASNYQKSRIENICKKLNLKSITPLWHKNEEEYWKELFRNKFEIMVLGVASYGLEEKWLGKIINKKDLEELKKLKKEVDFHLAFEGGEAETFVTDCPLFKKKIKVIEGKKHWDGTSGRYNIEKLKLIGK